MQQHTSVPDIAKHTHGTIFTFALNQQVAIAANPVEKGNVISQLASVHSTDQYLLAYTNAQGEFCQAWFFEDQLVAVPEATNIDAVHQAEARAEEAAVAQANVAADKPARMFVGTGTLKIGAVDFQNTADRFARLDLGRGNASVSLYIPDIDQKPGESLADFLLRAATALQGQAASL